MFDELFASNMVDHDLPPGTPPGPAGSKAKIGAFTAAFPDIQFTFESEVVDGDRIAGRGYFVGTHQGAFHGIPATGKKVKVRFMDQWRFENGKVAEYWGAPDVASLMSQLHPNTAPTVASQATGAVAGQNEAGQAFMKAFRENDVEAIVALYAEDAVYYPTDTLALKGTKDIRASFLGLLGAFTVVEASTTETMHETYGDTSLAWGKWRGTLKPKAGGDLVRFEGRFSDVSKKVDGRWLYVFDHASFPTAPSKSGKAPRS